MTRRDYTEATESTIDMTMLPKVMQVKNFGKRSRTKYTHLVDQDTTISSGGFGGTAPVKQGGTSLEGGGCFLCGGPHLKKGLFDFVECHFLNQLSDCPQNTGPLTKTVAHDSDLSKQMGPPPRNWREGRDRESDNGYQSRRDYRKDSRRRSRSRSTSRTPPPPRRRRDRSLEGDYRDKRRRIE